MTRREIGRGTVADVVEAAPEGQRELAAARFMLQVADLLARARDASGKTQRELADSLGVSEGRVSQVLAGEGDFKISTIARYLRAMGYQAIVDAVPAAANVRPLIKPTRRPRRRQAASSAAVYHDAVVHKGQLSHRITIVPEGVSPEAPSVSRYTWLGVADNSNTRLPVVGLPQIVGRELENL